VDFNDFNGVTVGASTSVPVSTTYGFVFGSANSDWTLGQFNADLGDNGVWGAGETFAHMTNPSGGAPTLRFSLSPGLTVQKIGGVLSYDPGAGGSLTITARDTSGAQLETYNVNFVAPSGADGYNEGQFFGISRAAADIASFSVQGGTFVVDNLTFSAPVPEPGEYLMMLVGLGAVGAWVRRSKRTIARLA
jgi:hypothetical protein